MIVAVENLRSRFNSALGPESRKGFRLRVLPGGVTSGREGVVSA